MSAINSYSTKVRIYHYGHVSGNGPLPVAQKRDREREKKERKLFDSLHKQNYNIIAVL